MLWIIFINLLGAKRHVKFQRAQKELQENLNQQNDQPPFVFAPWH
jgi:hypothetical protein